jgi:hypothetical protein
MSLFRIRAGCFLEKINFSSSFPADYALPFKPLKKAWFFDRSIY